MSIAIWLSQWWICLPHHHYPCLFHYFAYGPNLLRLMNYFPFLILTNINSIAINLIVRFKKIHVIGSPLLLAIYCDSVSSDSRFWYVQFLDNELFRSITAFRKLPIPPELVMPDISYISDQTLPYNELPI